MLRRSTLAVVAIYYCAALIFTILSYGLLRLVYGRIEISFLEWIVIMFLAFTIGFIPNWMKMFRKK